jgi:putative membrane protein
MFTRVLHRNQLIVTLGVAVAAIALSNMSAHPQTMPDAGGAGAYPSGPTTAPESGGDSSTAPGGKSSGATESSGGATRDESSTAPSRIVIVPSPDMDPAAASMMNRNLLQELAAVSRYQIEVAQLAQKRSASEQVRSFAQRMLDENTAALEQAQRLAQETGVKLPATLDREHRAAIQRLSRLSGAAFDRQFIAKAGMADQQANRILLERITARASDPRLQRLAVAMMPAVEQNMVMAQELHEGMGGYSIGK